MKTELEPVASTGRTDPDDAAAPRGYPVTTLPALDAPGQTDPADDSSELSALLDDNVMRVAYAEHGRALFEFVLTKTGGDRQWAEDVVQETMLRLWRHMRHTDFLRDLRPLLFTMARRQVIDGYRRRGARPREVGAWELEEIPAADDLDRSLVALTVKRALMFLNPAHRAVIVALYFQGRTINDVAQLLGIPVGTVKSRAYYGLCALRETLRRLGVNGVG